MTEKEQDIIIAFANLLVDSMADLFDNSQIEEIIGKKGLFWKKEKTPFPAGFTPEIFKGVINRIVDVLFKSFGFDFIESRLDHIYTELKKSYSADAVTHTIMPYIPEGYLEKHRIPYLSKEELEVRVLEKTKELQKSNAELEDKIKARTIELKNLLIEQQKVVKMLIHRDMELTKANERLQELDKIKSDFISIVAHQLRTPLSGIKWTLSILIKGDLGPLTNDQKDFLIKSYDSNTRMITLVNEMLVVDGIQSGKINYRFKYINIVGLIENVIFDLRPQSSQRHILVEYKRKFEDLPKVYVDPEKMQAVLQNLLENGIKYTIEGGRVGIDIKKESDHLLISIIDNGIGIPKDQERNVFTKFFRANNAIKQETDGSGLGLYIAKTIIEKSGGKIWFESKEGKGSTFYFTVPF